jgi:hypothetical protein
MNKPNSREFKITLYKPAQQEKYYGWKHALLRIARELALPKSFNLLLQHGIGHYRCGAIEAVGLLSRPQDVFSLNYRFTAFAAFPLSCCLDQLLSAHGALITFF